VKGLTDVFGVMMVENVVVPDIIVNPHEFFGMVIFSS